MSEHLFALEADASPVTVRGGPSFDTDEEGPYQFVSDETVVSRLKEQTDTNGNPKFRWLSTEKLDRILTSEEQAIRIIKAGECDGILDLLSYAEQQRYGERKQVTDAINNRKAQIYGRSIV